LISKHIDLIAIAFLLFVIAAFSGAKHVVVMTMSGPVHYIRMENNREVRVHVMPAMPEFPEVPRMPRLPLQRD
jgi:hypothetical protein